MPTFLYLYYSFRLNIWDIGGQKSLRSYWRNYYEQTDGMVWIVDCSDIRQLDDCRQELHGLLKEEVSGEVDGAVQSRLSRDAAQRGDRGSAA